MQKVKSIATKRRGRISKIKFYLGKDNLELVSFLRDNIAVYKGSCHPERM